MSTENDLETAALIALTGKPASHLALMREAIKGTRFGIPIPAPGGPEFRDHVMAMFSRFNGSDALALGHMALMARNIAGQLYTEKHPLADLAVLLLVALIGETPNDQLAAIRGSKCLDQAPKQ